MTSLPLFSALSVPFSPHFPLILALFPIPNHICRLRLLHSAYLPVRAYLRSAYLVHALRPACPSRVAHLALHTDTCIAYHTCAHNITHSIHTHASHHAYYTRTLSISALFPFRSTVQNALCFNLWLQNTTDKISVNKTGKSPKFQEIRFPSGILNVKRKNFEKSS